MNSDRPAAVILLLVHLIICATAGMVSAETIPPVITYPAHLDLDANRVLDALDTLVAEMILAGQGNDSLRVIVIMYDAPDASDLSAFDALGGVVQSVWQHAIYGLSGDLPAVLVHDLPPLFGPKLAYVRQNDSIPDDMDKATRIVGVRNRVWTTYGWQGDENGTIAILDTGIDAGHDDLADCNCNNSSPDVNDWNNACATCDTCTGDWSTGNCTSGSCSNAYRVQYWKDFFPTPVNGPRDLNGHGTFVAGCAAGDGSGNSAYKGIAPNSRLTGFRVPSYVDDTIDAMDAAVQYKLCARIKVTNISRSVSGENTALIDAANNMVRNGIVTTLSAGNRYDDSGGPYAAGSPSRAHLCLTVGATNDGDSVTSYSSNGPGGSVKPELVAPGGSKLSTTGKLTGCDSNPNDTYTDLTGTSFSAPIVAGAASIVIDAWEQTNGTYWTWDKDDALAIKGVLVMTACEIDTAGETPSNGAGANSPGQKSRGGHDLHEGFGRLNVDAAVEAITMGLCAGEMGVDSLGNAPTDKKVWARRIVAQGPCVQAFLDVPSTGDFDLYLYESSPDTMGIPVIKASSVAASLDSDESISLNIGASTTDTLYLVVKWVYGHGDFGVYYLDATSPGITDVTSSINDTKRVGLDVAWIDFDGDGDEDLFASGDVLYENNGSGAFSIAATFSDLIFTRCVTWGDYDNDGDADLYIGGGAFYGIGDENKNRLYRNDGGSGFTDVSDTLSVAFAPTTQDVAWVDYDNDGDIDLYLAFSPDVITPDPPQFPNVMYQNNGASGFVDVAATIGLNDSSRTQAFAWGDYDNDGDQDVYNAAFDSGDNKLLRNDGVSGFTDVTASPLDGAGDYTDAAWGDFDNDGDLDLYLTRQTFYDSGNNQLFENSGSPNYTFSAVTPDELKLPGSSTSASWSDFDNDGNLDLLVATYGDGNRLIKNKGLVSGQRSWVDVTIPPLPGLPNARHAVWGDLENDGDLDIYSSIAYPDSNSLFELEDITCSVGGDGPAAPASVGSNNWFKLRLTGVTSNKSAIGARVELTSGGVTQIREVESYSGNSHTVEFGLGEESLISLLVIRWPNGTTQQQTGVAANRSITVQEDGDIPTGGAEGSSIVSYKLYPNYPNPFNPRTTIRFDVPAASQVRLTVYDVKGRRVRQLENGTKPAGSHRTVWDGTNDGGRRVASGVYFYRLVAEGYVETRKLVLLK